MKLFGILAFVVSLPVSLSFARFGIDHLEPVRWQAFVLPVLVAGAAGAIGGLARARERLSEGGGATVLAAIDGGARALWWGTVLALVGVLFVAALSPAPVGSYARFVDRAGAGGAATLVGHALLLPNQSVLVLSPLAEPWFSLFWLASSIPSACPASAGSVMPEGDSPYILPLYSTGLCWAIAST